MKTRVCLKYFLNDCSRKGDFKILYHDKPLKIKIISFCGLVKRGKDLKGNKYIKIKNRLASIKTWEVFHAIHENVYEKLNLFKFFAILFFNIRM